jgi:hypothetical protein
MYYVISSLVFFALELFLGSSDETYMLRQLICAAATIPVVHTFYRQDKVAEDAVYGKKKFRLDSKCIVTLLAAICGTAALGIAVNNIIAMTPLMEVSEGFAEANESFFGGTVLYEFLGSCFVIPVAEELLFRGVVYKRLKLYLGVRSGIILSAVIFGLMHFNIVQFLYAGMIGLLLAFLLEETGFLCVPVLGHMAANTVAVLREETGWLQFAYEPTGKGIAVTIGCLLLAGVSVWVIYRFGNSVKKDEQK